MGVNIPGPTPKPGAARRNKDTFSPTRELVADGVVRGPDLPEIVNWCKETKEFYESFRRSPLAQLCETDTDWEAIKRAALAHHKLWSMPGMVKAGEVTALTKEIDRIMASYGATYADRLKLRVRIKGVDDKVANGSVPEADNVISLPDYKAMLGG